MKIPFFIIIEIDHTASYRRYFGQKRDYHLLLPEHPELFVYERTWNGKRWLVAANLSEKEISLEEVRDCLDETMKIVISNYKRTEIPETFLPYEAWIAEKIG